MRSVTAAAQDLRTPTLLLAMPQVLDPYFHRGVVLLLAHEEEGSFGFLLNRPTAVRVAEVLSGLEMQWHGAAGALAYFGGPVQPELGSVLYGCERQGEEAPAQALPGIALTQQLGDLQSLASDPPERFRLFLGYAGWGKGQLMEEIERHDWLLAPVLDELVFADAAEGVWSRALLPVGVDPATLPSWSAPGPEEQAN
jgi:putative transcriptional regulator